MAGMFLFALIMRRGRRDERETAAGGLTVEDATQSALAAAASAATAAADPDVSLDEAHMPRWRRPSVQAARQGSARFGPPVSRPALRFAAPAPTGVERVAVHYRFVRVADAPDDVRSVELGRLDRGDEVDVLDRRTGFALVRAPDGLEGWVPRMTLGQLDFASD
jgi:hypothetical protein